MSGFSCVPAVLMSCTSETSPFGWVSGFESTARDGPESQQGGGEQPGDPGRAGSGRRVAAVRHPVAGPCASKTTGCRRVGRQRDAGAACESRGASVTKRPPSPGPDDPPVCRGRYTRLSEQIRCQPVGGHERTWRRAASRAAVNSRSCRPASLLPQDPQGNPATGIIVATIRQHHARWKIRGAVS